MNRLLRNVIAEDDAYLLAGDCQRCGQRKYVAWQKGKLDPETGHGANFTPDVVTHMQQRLTRLLKQHGCSADEAER